jgi:hypothetical protein
MKRFGFALVAAAILSGCGSDSTGPSSTATGDFDITISSGTKPTYSWAGSTGAHSVSVVRVSAPTTIVWGIALGTITSPVTHGTIPANSFPTMVTETTLTAGVAYRVSITLTDQKTGYKEFTP